MRKGLECAYELPVGQTRTQALIQSEQRLREELRSHGSLIYALRCVGSDEATQILCRLRQGAYDEALSGRNFDFGSKEPASEVFPWEYPAREDVGPLNPDLETLSRIPTFHDARSDHTMGSRLQPTLVNSTTVCPNDLCQFASAYTTPGSGFPPRLSLDKILSKTEGEFSVTTQTQGLPNPTITPG